MRVARGIGKNETEASEEVFRTLKHRGHADTPPAILSDGWGGIDEAMLAVYGSVPEYSGRGRPPTRLKPGQEWKYLQMVKQRDEHGHFLGVKLKAIYGEKSELLQMLGKSTAYIERSHLTARMFNARLTRKTLAFSKNLSHHRNAVIWEDAYYNLVRPHKSLRLAFPVDSDRKWLPRTPAVAANLTDHIWTVKELLTTVPLPCPINT